MDKKRPTLSEFFHNRIKGKKGRLFYRGKYIRFYDDDYGQQVYFYYKHHQYCCGAYNFCYEDEAKYIIDTDLDFICSMKPQNEKIRGSASIKYGYNEKTGRREVKVEHYGLDVNHPLSWANRKNPELLKAEANKILNEIYEIKIKLEKEHEEYMKKKQEEADAELKRLQEEADAAFEKEKLDK